MKKKRKKAFLGIFWKISTKKLRFFGALPPQFWYRLAPKAPLEKLNGQSAKNGYLKIVQRGDPLGRQEVESLRGVGGGGVLWASAFQPLPQSATVAMG